MEIIPQCVDQVDSIIPILFTRVTREENCNHIITRLIHQLRKHIFLLCVVDKVVGTNSK